MQRGKKCTIENQQQRKGLYGFILYSAKVVFFRSQKVVYLFRIYTTIRYLTIYQLHL